MKMRTAIISIALAASLADAGGLGTLEGSVVVAGGSAAGARVEVVCGGLRRSVTVDGSGNFTVSGLPEGTCTVTIRRSGMADSVQTVTITGGSIASMLASMRPPVKEDAHPPVATAVAEAPEPSPPPREPLAKREPPKRVMAKPEKKPMEQKPQGGGARADVIAVPPKVVRLDGKPGRKGIAMKPPADAEVVADNGGFAAVRVFPVPQYTKGYEGPRTDFRETIYWNPSVQTDATGKAEVTFFVSDAVTAFRATAEGFSSTGTPGAGQLAFQSKLPMTLDAKLPVEVTAGDTIQLPVTLANETAEPIDATLDARFGTAFKLSGNPGGSIRLAPGEKKAMFFTLDVVATKGSADVELAARAAGLSDEVKKTIRVVPKGFPFEVSAAGTAKRGQLARHELDLTGALQGSIEATVTMYASPVASMTQGLEGMVREPYGCFEQASSATYPNIMVLSYLQAHDAADPALVDRTQGAIDRGYKLLTGYETKQRGYEWFGTSPGHEALTAYGLMEFADMSKVFDVDQKMVARTAEWLMSRRDGKGGFRRDAKALDTFGRASETTTNAYIMWALAEAKRTSGMDAELAAQQQLAASTSDPYLLALAANTLQLARNDTAAVKRLAGMQAKDGGLPGAKQSITMSGGEALVIETTALALLAFVKSPEHTGNARAAVEWLNKKRSGHGEWGNTQATVLGLKALTAYAQSQRQMSSGGSATLIINGRRVRSRSCGMTSRRTSGRRTSSRSSSSRMRRCRTRSRSAIARRSRSRRRTRRSPSRARSRSPARRWARASRCASASRTRRPRASR
jgi:alpha-2-macroglobulin-like protein